MLAYSGGLDTSVAVHWMTDEWDVDVIALAVDVGQRADDDWDTIRDRALPAGAVEALVVDARDEFADEYCLPALHANALYEGKYPLVSALSRPVIVKHLVAAAREHGADAVAHGCTGKGNDQVRFEVSARRPRPRPRRARPRPRVGLHPRGLHRVRRPSTTSRSRSDATARTRSTRTSGAEPSNAVSIEDPWVAPPSEPYALTDRPDRRADRPVGARRLLRGRRPRRARRHRPCPSPISIAA